MFSNVLSYKAMNIRWNNSPKVDFYVFEIEIDMLDWECIGIEC